MAIMSGRRPVGRIDGIVPSRARRYGLFAEFLSCGVMRYSLVLSLVVAVLAVAFALVNNETVTVHLGLATVQNQSLALVLLVTLFAGVIVGILASLPGRLRARRRIKSLENELRKLRKSDTSSSEKRSDPEDSDVPRS